MKKTIAVLIAVVLLSIFAFGLFWQGVMIEEGMRICKIMGGRLNSLDSTLLNLGCVDEEGHWVNLKYIKKHLTTTTTTLVGNTSAPTTTTTTLCCACPTNEYAYKIVFEPNCDEIGIPECGGWAIVKTKEIHIVDGQSDEETLKALCHEKCCIDVQELIISGQIPEMTHNEIDTDNGYCDWRNDWVIDDTCKKLFKNMMETKRMI